MFTTKYVKEDLPTYSEMVHEFWEKGFWRSCSSYPSAQDTFYELDPDWYDMDPYWEIPRFKVLLATACNQFNKMMYVDNRIRVSDIYPLFASANGLAVDMVDFIQFYTTNSAASVYVGDMCKWRPHFAISREGIYQTPLGYNPHVTDLMNKDHIPPIYELGMPNGKPNPFVIEDPNIKRILVNDIDGMIKLKFVWNCTDGFYHNSFGPVSMIWNREHDHFQDLLQVFMKPIIEDMSR